MDYAKTIDPARTPQTEPLPGQQQNNAGGYSYPVDDWKRLDRFMVLGTEGGTYYVGERKLTVDNAQAVRRCIAEDGVRVVKAIVAISDAGRAPKNDPALFALALAAREGNEATKRAAYEALPSVARTGTHLFHWASYMKTLGGLSGNGAKRAVGKWYQRPAPALALQAVKYQSRDGWSHRDLLRLAHPKSPTPQHGLIYDWMTHGWPSVGQEPHDDLALRMVWAFERAKTARGAELIKLIAGYDLPHECVPNEAKGDPKVWEAMLPHMGVTAMIRNLGKMTAVGLISPLSSAEADIVSSLGDTDRLRRGRVHPLAVLMALKVYAQGKGDKGSLAWSPSQRVLDALDAAFYTTFANVEPTGKRWMLAIDISGSMDLGAIAGMAGISPRIGAAAMAMITAATEKQHHMVAYETSLTPLSISPRTRMDTVVQAMRRMQMGGTDCALPIVYAEKNKIPVDVFVSYTDSETWAGPVHPMMALKIYRQKMGIPAKMITVGMTANEFTIGDPNDAGCLDVVGLDPAAPSVMSDFAK
jgi:60 kDa SS-A/Ro ribonucleoprotein